MKGPYILIMKSRADAAHGNSARIRRQIALPLIFILLANSGCVPTAQFINQLGVGGISADDRCGQHSQSLREAKGYFERSMVQGAAIGAIGGAILGGLLGGSGKSALIGSLAGGALGAGTGYWTAKQQETQDRAQLAGTVYRDLDAERSEILRALASFSQVRECRLNAARVIKTDFAAGRIDRSTATSLLDSERRRFADDIIVVQAIGAKIDERHEELIVAVDSIAASDPEARQLLQESKEAERQAYLDTSWKNPDADAPDARVTATSNVNVRKEPSAGAPRVQLFQAGDTAKSLATTVTGWTKIELNNGNIGYVSSKYIEHATPAPQRTADNFDTGTSHTTLASLTRSVSPSADTETKVVGVMFEGREKRLELERLTQQAEKEENTVFSLDAS